MKSLVFFILLSCIPFSLFGKINGKSINQGHRADYFDVLGLDRKNKGHRQFETMISDPKKGFPKYIDNKEDADMLCRKIQKINPHFSYGTYSHRLFFHWAFNLGPQESKAIKNRLNDCQASPDQCSKIMQIIIDEQIIRNNAMRDCVKNAIEAKNGTSTAYLDHSQITSIATIIYDVHVLGDYIEGIDDTRSALPPINDVINDILHSCTARKLDTRDYKKINDIEDALNGAKYISNDPSVIAERVLSLLKVHIPPPA